MGVEEVPEWFGGLDEEDVHFVKRFILASGSLKEMARQYDVSYPTVRLRLDRLIEKISILDDPREKTPFHGFMQILVAEGRVDISTARKILKAFEKNCG